MLGKVANLTFSFGNPFWLLACLGIPLLFWFQKRKRQGALYFSSVALTDLMQKSSTRFLKTLSHLRLLTYLSLIIALAKPQILRHYTENKASGVDIILGVDISSSMLALDLMTDKQNLRTRLDVAKEVLKEFIDCRASDRIGLIAFAESPYLVSPLTLNKAWLQKSLERLRVGMVPDGTAIGSAIGVCINRLRKIEAKSRILILLTDGINNSGKLSPLAAAELAVSFGIKIYTVLIGKGGIVPTLYVNSQGSIARNPWNQPDIIRVQFPSEEETLKKIAQLTHGEFYQASSKKSLKSIYSTIDQLERSEVKLRQYTQVQELFFVFALIAFLSLSLELLLKNTRFFSIP